MSANQRSIGQRLARAKSREALSETVRDWAKDWCRDQGQALEILQEAIARQDWKGVAFAEKQLVAITEKRFSALRGVLDTLLERGAGSPEKL